MRIKVSAPLSLLALGTCLNLASQNQAHAQSSPAAESRREVGIEEVVVTAQRREESLQDVPVAITALSAAALGQQGVTTTQGLDQMTPGLVSTTSAGVPQRYIRGVGGQLTALNEQPVAVYVNGMYVASSSGSLFSFNNIERVEVLKGPQGTLFGRNATGGVVQVITKAPSQESAFDVSASYGNYETAEVATYLNGGITDTVAANFSFYGREQGKGYGRNLFLDRRINEQDDRAARLEVLITPTDSLSLRLSADYAQQESDIGISRNVLAPSRTVLGGGQAGGSLDANFDTSPDSKNEQWGVGQELSLDLNGARLRSITSYRDFKLHALYDTDVTPVALLNADRQENSNSFQQELLLDGQLNKFSWTTGVFFLKLENGNEPVLTYGSSATGNVARYTDGDVRSYAAYAQGTYAVTEKLNVTAGARYTRDRSTLSGRFLSTTGFPGGAGQTLQAADNRKFTNSKPTWRLAVDYNLTDDVLAYASYNRGFKSGSFNHSSLTQDPTDPEVLDAYEIGLKSEFFDHRLRLNVSAFDYDYKDIQLTAVQLPSVLLLNAASASSKGAEIEMQALPPIGYGRLQWDVGVSLLDAEYDKFPNAPYFLPNPYTAVPAGLSCPTPTSASPGGNTTCEYDASGERAIRSPKWTVSTALNYIAPLAVGDLSLSVSYYHNDGFFWETSRRSRQKAYDIWNAEVAFSPKNGPWRFKLFGRNLGDEDYYSSVSESSFGDVSTGQPPRTYGFGVDYSWGG